MQKLDPYLNVDPGTMNPFQHGEVFVTEDGAETDLDVGHYERFLDEELYGAANVTTGKVYSEVIAKERRGRVPRRHRPGHPAHHRTRSRTGSARWRCRRPASDDIDVVITEIGGTVGDIESLPFLEAARQVRQDVGRDNVFFLHVSLVPYLAPSGEQKSKPTQHSVQSLRSIGITPDAIVCRSDRPIPASLKRKIAQTCDVDNEAVVSAPDAASIYDIPKVLHDEGLDAYVVRRLSLPFRDVDWAEWDELLRRVHQPSKRATIALVGKYVDLPDAYLSVTEALRAAGAANDTHIDIRWVTSDDCEDPEAAARTLDGVDGVLVPGGFGVRGIEGKLGAVRHAREHRIPTLGLCLGLQCMVIDVARNLAGPRRRELRRVRRRHAAPGDLDHGRPARRRRRRARHGRHDAARLLPGDAAGGLAGRGGVRQHPGRRASPAPLRGRQLLPRPSWRPPAWCSPARRRTAGWSSSSSCRRACTRSSSAPRRTRSSSRGRPARIRCSPVSSRPRSNRASAAQAELGAVTLPPDGLSVGP